MASLFDSPRYRKAQWRGLCAAEPIAQKMAVRDLIEKGLNAWEANVLAEKLVPVVADELRAQIHPTAPSIDLGVYKWAEHIMLAFERRIMEMDKNNELLCILNEAANAEEHENHGI